MHVWGPTEFTRDLIELAEQATLPFASVALRCASPSWLRNPRIATALSGYGFTQEDMEEGWKLQAPRRQLAQ